MRTAPPIEWSGRIAPRELKGLTHADALRLILSRSSSPLTIKQMLQILEGAGRKLSKNGCRVIYRALRKDKAFQSFDGAWWAVRNEADPSAHEQDTPSSEAGRAFFI